MTSSPPLKSPWQIRVDTGGTFTDCLAVDPTGETHRAKVLSCSALRGSIIEKVSPTQWRIREKWNAPRNFIKGFDFFILGTEMEGVEVLAYDPSIEVLTLARELTQITMGTEIAFEVRSPEEAPVLAARIVTRTPLGTPLPPLQMRLATTRGTNALLERKGQPPVLFITRGFRDLLEIGTQQRPDLFALDIVKPRQLYAEVIEIEERLCADGSVLRPLDLTALEADCARLIDTGHRVAAVALMHSYCNSAHEESLAEFLRSKGFTHVSTSSDLAQAIRLLPRAQTTVVNAYLAPVIDAYLSGVESQVGVDSLDQLHVMTSAGGLASPRSYHPKDSLLSGPAGGVVGAATVAQRSGFTRTVAFDMGGTSTDVSRFDNDYSYVFEHRVGDAFLMAPALAIETVAAGGGSICRCEGGRLRVGPESAGAYPGPACYGAGGPLTITDVNLLLGRLIATDFEIPLSLKAAWAQLQNVRDSVHLQTGETIGDEALLDGFLQIANERMADAIRRISVSDGYNPAEYALVSFGGAGGQHACAIAQLLGIATIIVPRDASLLSALGLGNAVLERFAERQVLRPFSEITQELETWIDELEAEARRAVEAERIEAKEIAIRRRMVNLRFLGQDSTVTIDYTPGMQLADAFLQRYEELFGYKPEHKAIELESIRVVASSRTEPYEKQDTPAPTRAPMASTTTRIWTGGRWREIPIYQRDLLKPGSTDNGPALIVDRHTSVLIEPEWTFQFDPAENLILTMRTSP